MWVWKRKDLPSICWKTSVYPSVEAVAGYLVPDNQPCQFLTSAPTYLPFPEHWEELLLFPAREKSSSRTVRAAAASEQ